MTNKQQALKWWKNLSQEKREMYIEILFDEKNISDAEIIEQTVSNKKNKATQRSPFDMW